MKEMDVNQSLYLQYELGMRAFKRLNDNESFKRLRN